MIAKRGTVHKQAVLGPQIDEAAHVRAQISGGALEVEQLRGVLRGLGVKGWPVEAPFGRRGRPDIEEARVAQVRVRGHEEVACRDTDAIKPVRRAQADVACGPGARLLGHAVGAHASQLPGPIELRLQLSAQALGIVGLRASSTMRP